MQLIIGSGHKLVLLMAARGGFLLGLFVANLAALDKDWKPKWHFLLQLVLAIGFSATASFIAMSAAWFCPPATLHHVKNNNLVDEESYSDLSIVQGTCPSIDALMGNLKDWCTGADCRFVGVVVSGPESLTLDVMKAANKSSLSSVQFVVDEAAFEW